MLLNKIFLLGVLITFMVLPCLADSVEGLPLHVQKITDNVICLWVGNYSGSTTVSAIATQKGIVVIDSTDIPKLDQAFRKVIEKEFARNDFKYLINTHGHRDHTAGNGVYRDCQIIAHESAAEMMKENFNYIPQRIERNNRNIQRLKNEIESGKLNDEQKAIANERLMCSVLEVEFLESSPQPVFPTITFRDKLVLDCGDVTFELYQGGGTHTQSDIFILVPQKGVLFIGDILATFGVLSGTTADYPVLQKNWKSLIDRKNEITYYIPGHWKNELTFKEFQDRYNYTNDLVTAVKALVDTNGNLNQFIADYALKNKFPYLLDSPGVTEMGHLMSIEHLYGIYSGKVSLDDALMELTWDNDFSTGFGKLKEDFFKAKDRFFYVEMYIDRIGYALLQQKKFDDAIKIFELNVELHPVSWNVYNSLAEAYYMKGDKVKALELFKKSLVLNPQNENGKKFIEQIEKEVK